MEVELYQWTDGKRTRAATRELFAQIRMPAKKLITDAVTKSGEPVYEDTDTPLDTDEKIAQTFPGGVWHKAVFRDDVLGADRDKAESKMWAGGEYKPWKRGRAWVLTLLVSWTWPEVRNEESYDKLCEDAIIILENTVMEMRENFSLPKNSLML